ncbi:MAG: alpha-galactosidase [Phycisphaeraceae bacterium]|nr:alpha-galactosidase [Phycisphaeraceae bacterium]
MTHTRLFNILAKPLILVLLGSLCLHTNAAPYPPEIAKWDDATKQAQRDSGTKLLADVQAAVKAGEKNIVIPKGDYRFDKLLKDRRPMHVLWSDMEGVTIDLQGSTFWFENPRAGIVLARNKNFTLKNVNLDWDPLPFIQGKIMAIDHQTQQIHVKIDEGYDQPVNDFTKVKNHWRGMIFDPKTRRLKEQVIGFALDVTWNNRTPEGYQIVKLNGFYGVKLEKSGIDVGDDIAMLRRMGRAMRIETCENNTLENVTCYSSPFVTFAQNFGRGSATFRNVNILRRPGTNRLIGSNADGINVGNMQYGPTLENCRMEFLGDDFVNIHSAYNRIVWQNSPTELVSSLMNGYGANDANDGKDVEILFFDRKTMKKIGSRKVVKVTTNNQYPVDQDKCLFSLKDWFRSGIASQFREGAKTARAHIITLDKPIQITGDVVTTLPDYISAGGVVRNCHFIGSLARGIRLQAPKAVIENNIIENVMGYGISMCGQPSYWGEGPYVHTTVARNNKLIDCGIGPANRNCPAIYVQQSGDYTQSDTQYDITIANNTIANCGAMGIMVRGVIDLKLLNNNIEGYYLYKVHEQRDPMPEDINGTGYGIVLDAITGLTMKGNTVSQPGPFAKGDVFKVRIK